MTRVWLWLLGGVLAVALTVTAIDHSTMKLGVGSTSLVVVCLVTEEGKRTPVAGAKIHVHTESQGDFVLTTDVGGVATRYYPLVTSTTRESALGFTNQWTCEISAWDVLWVTADGYEPKEIDGLRGIVTPLRERSEMPTLVVRIPLKKLPVKGAAP